MKVCSVLSFLWGVTISNATTLVLPVSGDVVGEIQYASSEPGETIDDVGRRFDLGHYELLKANSHLSERYPFVVNSQLIIPLQFILPNVPRKGIVINLAEYRLYYFPENENVVITFPIGIGRKGWSTPLGVTRVVAKEANPKWRPTEKVRAEAEKYGNFLPDTFPSNSYNPLGKYALRLSWPTFLIHGTNRRDGIGMRVSAGCIRMFPDDIEHLFHLISIGTQVRVINEPIKIGRQQDGAFVLQIHPLLSKEDGITLKFLLQKKLSNFNVSHWTNNKIIQNELKHPSGLVRRI